MSKVISLISKSTRLLISLHGEDCGFSVSEDRTTLIFDGKDAISNISLQLSSEGKKIHTFDFLCIRYGRVNSVRLDALFPLVFEDAETINFGFTGCANQLPTFDGRTYNLKVKLTYDGDLILPSVKKINSISLTLEATKVRVSREVLGISSDFFSTFFYGNFAEKNSGNFVIKEVDATTFSWLANALVEREWNFSSVDQALSVMEMADRFRMNNVPMYILSYLKSTQRNLPLDMMNRFASLAARCKDNGEFVGWIFETCQSTTDLTAVAQSCGPFITPHLPLFFEFLTTKQEEEKTRKAEKIEKLTRESKAKDAEKRVLSEQNTALVKKNDLFTKEIVRLAKENRDLDEDCNGDNSKNLIVLPTTAILRGNGGKSIHTLINTGDCKIMYRCTGTHSTEYAAITANGFIDAGASVQMEITRKSPWPAGPASDRVDDYYVRFAPAPEGATGGYTEAQKAFEGKDQTGQVVLLLKAE